MHCTGTRFGFGVLLFTLWIATCVFSQADGAVSGRYVRLENPSGGLPRLLAEVEVYAGGVNAAVSGSVRLSSQGTGRNAPDSDVLINGDTAQGYEIIQRGDAYPWVEVDLGESRSIERIAFSFSHRRDTAPQIGIPNGLLVVVLDDARNVVWHQRYPRGGATIEPKPFDARYAGRHLPLDLAESWYDLTSESRVDWTWHGNEVELALTPHTPEETARRRAIFAARDSDESVAELARQLHAALLPDRPALQAFYAHYDQGDYRAALDAFRDYVFDRLKNRETHGIPSHSLSAYFPGQPDWIVVSEAMAGRRRVEYGVHDFGFPNLTYYSETVSGEVGPPGASLWAPNEDLGVPDDATWGISITGSQNGLWAPENARLPLGPGLGHPFWSTPEGSNAVRHIELFNAGLRGPTFDQYYDLLKAYAAGGDRAYLVRWMDYLDDWYLFGREDIFRSRLNLLQAAENTSRDLQRRLANMTWLLENQPAFEEEMRSTTLARFVLGHIEDCMPYTVRMTRTELANWGIFSTSFGLMWTWKILPDFKAIDYLAREAFHTWQLEWIHAYAPDGHNAETERGAYQSTSLEAFDHAFGGFNPDWLDPVEMEEVTDKARRSIRQILSETTPDGVAGARFRLNYRHSQFGIRHGGNWVAREDRVFDHPEMAARLQLVNDEENAPLPQVLSELTPYGGKFMLRDQWGPDGGYFFMENYRQGSQNPFMRTRYTLRQSGQDLLYGTPILVDRRAPFQQFGKIMPVGGKTEYLGQAPRHVMDTRFHGEGPLMLAEAKQDAQYGLRTHWSHYWGAPDSFAWGPHVKALDYVNEPIRDVTAWRQAVSVPGEQLYIVTDRMETFQAREYAKAHHVEIIDRNAADRAIRVDRDTARIVTEWDDHPNVDVRFFSPSRLMFFNRYHPETGEPEWLEGGPAEWLATGVRAPGYPVAARWHGRGDQVIVMLAHTSRTADDAPLRDVQPLNGDRGQAGFRAVTGSGAEIWYQAGPHAVNNLRAGPAHIRAESLLVLRKDGAWHGMVLSAQGPLVLDGATHTPDADSYMFTVAESGFAATPVQCPVDTVKIYPERNVFTDEVEVSFDIPTQDTREIEFRYTLDQSDPTLESDLYEGPFTLSESAMVKVRAFRKGLDETPYREGVKSSAIEYAYFQKETPRPADTVNQTAPGLTYTYATDWRWGRLFVHAGEDGVVAPEKEGVVSTLLDGEDIAAVRDGNTSPYAVVYRGYLDVPETGVYGVYAPQHLLDVTADAGFNMRVFIGGEEWKPSGRLHAENAWYVALQEGNHPFEVRFVDYRRDPPKNEYWMIGRTEAQWQGIPALEISGPDRGRGPVPEAWLRR